jgi:hypothetical protein
MKKVLILLMIAALLLPTAAFAKAAVPVTFDDPVLEAEIRAITGIPEGDVTDKDLAKITEISMPRDYEDNPDPSTQVHSLAVLVYCTKLTAIRLNFHNVSDISPLAKLKKLKTLELGGNPWAASTRFRSSHRSRRWRFTTVRRRIIPRLRSLKSSPRSIWTSPPYQT